MAPPFRAWPYAALAVIQWLHTAPSLFCWIVFRHPMDRDVKPPLATWIVSVDGVPKTPASSAWVDEWTLLLTIAAIPALPTSVTLEYDGPDDGLRTTWFKQWEPWGAIVATSFQLIPVGMIMIWSGAVVDIPPGWLLCDGNNGTPNLLGLSVIGAGGAFNPDDTGGATSHDHDFTGDGHWHSTGLGFPGFLPTTGAMRVIINPKSVTGTTDPETTRSPYYALCFVMKV